MSVLTETSPPPLLRQRNFLLVLVGQAISQFGTAAYQLTVAWTVYQVTSSSLALGLVLAVNVFAQVVFALVGGVFGDRLPRRRLVILSDTASALATGILALAAAAGQLSLTLIVVVSLVLGAASAFHLTAFRAFLPELVPVSELQRANGLLSSVFNVATIVGPGVGGALLAISGPSAVFSLESATFVVGAVTMFFVRPAARPAGQDDEVRESVLREAREGLRYVLRERWVMISLVLSMVANVFCLAPYLVLLPLVVEQAGGSAQTLGWITGSQAVVTTISALVIGMLPPFRSQTRVLLLLVVCLGLGTTLLGLAGDARLLLFLAAAVVGVGLTFDVVEDTLLQTAVPESFMSRVYSLNVITSFSLVPIAYVSSGALADAVGAHTVLITGGSSLVVVAVALLFYAPFHARVNDIVRARAATSLSTNGEVV